MKLRQWDELVFRWRKGYWCEHKKDVGFNRWLGTWRNLQRRTDGTGWEMIDCGMRQMRQCSQCGYTEFR